MSAEIPSQEPRSKPRKKAQPRSFKYTEVLDERGFLINNKAHVRALDAISCGCDNHETKGLTEIFRAGVTDPKTIFKTYDRYADLEHKAHRAYVEDGFKHVYQQAEDILKNDTV